MNNQKFITQIRDHIANNQLDTALQLLRDLLDNSPQLDEVIQQAGRYASIRQQIRLGTVSHTDATLTKNQIRMGLIDLLGEIETQGEKPRLREEIERAVSIVNSKNVNTGNIHADNVNIGDKTENHTTIKNSKNIVSHSTINAKRVSIGDRIIIRGFWIGLAILIASLVGFGIWHKDIVKHWVGLDRKFKENNENFKILILPFKSLCEYKGKQYDAGYAIKGHLEGIIAKESLKVAASYFKDYDFKKFDDVKAKELQKYHHADMIVYGSYQTGDCSSKGDKICLNYMTDQEWNLGEMSTDLDRTYKSGGLDELQEGKIQEKVEDIATFLSVIAQQKNIDRDRYIDILQKVLKEKDAGSFTKAYIYIRIADQLNVEGKLQEVIGLYKEALGIYQAENSKANIAMCHERIGSIYKDIGNMEMALQYLIQSSELLKPLCKNYPKNIYLKRNLGVCYEQCGVIYNSVGNLEKALFFFNLSLDLAKELHENHPENIFFKRDLGISYQYLGNMYFSKGNLNKALESYKLQNDLNRQLSEKYPQNIKFKNGLATSYLKLSKVHEALGNLTQALLFSALTTELSKQLYENYPQNVEFKNSLAISYSNIGDIHMTLGNFNEALRFFELRNKLGKQLSKAYPSNIDFNSGLAISYEKLGQIHSNLGDFKAAVGYFEQYDILIGQLSEKHLQNIKFQNNEAVSKQNLGRTHSLLGNLDMALKYFTQYNNMAEKLYENYPKNVDCKKILAISHLLLGQFYKDKIKDKQKAKIHVQKAYSFYSELIVEFPDYNEFQYNYKVTKNTLEGL